MSGDDGEDEAEAASGGVPVSVNAEQTKMEERGGWGGTVWEGGGTVDGSVDSGCGGRRGSGNVVAGLPSSGSVCVLDKTVGWGDVKTC